MKDVIVDCDNTLGIQGRDVDDGLMLLFLSGSSEINVIGITLTYGNSDSVSVEKATQDLVARYNIQAPLFVGGSNQESHSPASRFLAERVAEAPGKLTVIATGALTNLLGATYYNPNFFTQVKEIIVMGGILGPLEINGHIVEELNFSCDPVATKAVLLSEAPIVLMNGHLTQQAFFPTYLGRSLVGERVFQNDWLVSTVDSWCEWNRQNLGLDGFCNWDMTTAVYLKYPELFSHEKVCLSQHQDFSIGQIQLSDQWNLGKVITMPKKIVDVQRFNEVMIEAIQQGLASN